MSSPEENVLVVPREVFDRLGAFQGIRHQVDQYLPVLLQEENTRFLPRSLAETDPSFKQLIPYAVLTWENRILRYFRGGSSGEKRLVAKGSIGIGGHINDGDGDLTAVNQETYRRAVDRELAEELVLGGQFTERIVALLNDDSNEVGKVHLGVVHHLTLNSPDVQPGENALHGLEFLTPEQLLAERDSLETWSQIVLDHWRELQIANG